MSLNPKPTMTDEERLELAKKLDEDLEDYISNLPRTKYEDGWPEDRWEEEMAKHPFFMKEAPKVGDELHPLYEGLQKLKYDPEENEPQELAQSYKEDGNFNFKHKNYRLAIVAYTEGIKQKCGDLELEASLLNNRAAAHWFLKNYRSCLKDCELALKLKPTYDKVLNRALNCCYQLKQYDQAVEYCDQLLSKDKNNKEVLELRQKCTVESKLKQRNERKKETKEKKKKQLEETLVAKIKEKGYVIEGGNINLSTLEPCFPELVHHRVSFNLESDSLVWPVAFVYPEYKIMDYIQQFSEKDRIYDQLQEVFGTPPEWDTDNKYRSDNLSVYFEDRKQNLVKVDTRDTLEQVLKTPGFVIKGGTPNLIVLVKDSKVEQMMLKKC